MRSKNFGWNGSMTWSIILTIVWFLISGGSLAYNLFYKDNSLHFIVTIATLIIISLFVVVIMYYSFSRLKVQWKYLEPTTKLNIYNLVLKAIGLNSIFIIGIWKFYEASTILFPAIYITFIILSAAITASIISNELHFYLRTGKGFTTLEIPKCQIKSSKGKKFEIEPHKVSAKILKK